MSYAGVLDTSNGRLERPFEVSGQQVPVSSPALAE
jgi:hypothetical protein